MLDRDFVINGLDEMPDEWFRFKINNCPFVEF